MKSLFFSISLVLFVLAVAHAHEDSSKHLSNIRTVEADDRHDRQLSMWSSFLNMIHLPGPPPSSGGSSGSGGSSSSSSDASGSSTSSGSSGSAATGVRNTGYAWAMVLGGMALLATGVAVVAHATSKNNVTVSGSAARSEGGHKLKGSVKKRKVAFKDAMKAKLRWKKASDLEESLA